MENVFDWIVGIVAVIMFFALIGWTKELKDKFVHKFIVGEGFVSLLYKDGKFVERLGPGKHRRFGTDFTSEWVDLRKSIQTVPGQEVLTSDNLNVKVSLVVARQIVEPEKALHEVEDVDAVIHTAAQLALREIVAGFTSEQVLENRLNVREAMRQQVAPEAEKIGVKIHSIEVKDVMLPGEIRKAFTDVITARKEGEASLERARAESAALRNLANAARAFENNPGLLELRRLKAMEGAAQSYGNTVIMGLPEGVLPVVGKNKA